MKLSEQSCVLCGRSKLGPKANHPPQMQRAHVIANRFSAKEKRYKGVRNAFSKGEWEVLLDKFGSEFEIPKGSSFKVACKIASKSFSPMCAECHGEVLSEPFYFPSLLRQLRPYFEGKKRIQKMIFLA